MLEDPDITPKPVKQLQRTMSAGAFLKSEFHSTRGSRETDSSSVRIQMSQFNEVGEQISQPKIQDRRLSKSKNFFSSLGVHKGKKPMPIRQVDSTTSKNILIRRLSRGTTQNSSSDSTYTDSITSTVSSHPQKRINSRDIADTVIDSRIPSYDNGSLSSLSPGSMQNWPTSAREEFLLCPEITITPEILTLDAGSTNLWVAVEVTGTLRLANSHEPSSAELQESRRAASGYSAGMLFVAHQKNHFS
jgi:hypothetical protein